MFYLMDLERTIGSNQVHYWKANRYGYTTDIKEAGLFDESVALRLAEEDFDKRTVPVPKSVVEKIMKN